jgi:hypothetical protein
MYKADIDYKTNAEVFRQPTERLTRGMPFGKRGIHWVFQNFDEHPPS